MIVVSAPKTSRAGPAPKSPRVSAMPDVAAPLRQGPGLIESRSTPGRALMRHHNAVIGCLRGSKFPVPLASPAFSVIDAYVYGFVLTEQNLPFDSSADDGAEDFAARVALLIKEYPHLAELVAEVATGYTFADEFPYGLDVILDELQRRLDACAP
ncbi:MAG: TetR/AcrR family transcriptional regulator C-terminal domain-containing protein [Propionicimonas sp.]